MSRILSVSDYAAESLFGGAEMNTSAVIARLREMGHDVEDVGLKPSGKPGLYKRAELPDPVRLNHHRILLGNLTLYDPRWLADLVRIHGDRCVLWIHDAPWCMFRSGSCHGKWTADHAGCRVALYLPVVKKCRRVLFYSPYQAQIFDAMLGPLYEGKRTILPIFCDRAGSFVRAGKCGHRKPGSVLAAGRFSPAKGGDLFYMFAKRNAGKYSSIKAVGRCDPQRRKAMEEAGVECRDHVPPAEMVAEYASAEWFFHQPPQLDAGPRTIVEARLAGCKLIVGENCGYLSHPAWALDDEALAKHCETASSIAALEVLR